MGQKFSCLAPLPRGREELCRSMTPSTGSCVQKRCEWLRRNMKSAECRAVALRIAKDYERLAGHAERRAGQDAKMNR
jgi:hypothetical protein